MTITLSDMAYFYYNGRKVSYYEDLIQDLTIERAFEENEQKINHIEDRVGNLKRRAHAILKPKSFLEKVPYQFGRIVGC